MESKEIPRSLQYAFNYAEILIVTFVLVELWINKCHRECQMINYTHFFYLYMSPKIISWHHFFSSVTQNATWFKNSPT